MISSMISSATNASVSVSRDASVSRGSPRSSALPSAKLKVTCTVLGYLVLGAMAAPTPPEAIKSTGLPAVKKPNDGLSTNLTASISSDALLVERKTLEVNSSVQLHSVRALSRRRRRCTFSASVCKWGTDYSNWAQASGEDPTNAEAAAETLDDVLEAFSSVRSDIEALLAGKGGTVGMLSTTFSLMNTVSDVVMMTGPVGAAIGLVVKTIASIGAFFTSLFGGGQEAVPGPPKIGELSVNDFKKVLRSEVEAALMQRGAIDLVLKMNGYQTLVNRHMHVLNQHMTSTKDMTDAEYQQVHQGRDSPAAALLQISSFMRSDLCGSSSGVTFFLSELYAKMIEIVNILRAQDYVSETCTEPDYGEYKEKMGYVDSIAKDGGTSFVHLMKLMKGYEVLVQEMTLSYGLLEYAFAKRKNVFTDYESDSPQHFSAMCNIEGYQQTRADMKRVREEALTKCASFQQNTAGGLKANRQTLPAYTPTGMWAGKQCTLKLRDAEHHILGAMISYTCDQEAEFYSMQDQGICAENSGVWLNHRCYVVSDSSNSVWDVASGSWQRLSVRPWGTQPGKCHRCTYCMPQCGTFLKSFASGALLAPPSGEVRNQPDIPWVRLASFPQPEHPEQYFSIVQWTESDASSPSVTVPSADLAALYNEAWIDMPCSNMCWLNDQEMNAVSEWTWIAFTEPTSPYGTMRELQRGKFFEWIRRRGHNGVPWLPPPSLRTPWEYSSPVYLIPEHLLSVSPFGRKASNIYHACDAAAPESKAGCQDADGTEVASGANSNSCQAGSYVDCL